MSRDSPDDDWSSQSKHSAKVTLVCSWFHRTFLSIHIFRQKIANYFSSLLYAPPIFHISSPYFIALYVTVLRHLVCFNQIASLAYLVRPAIVRVRVMKTCIQLVTRQLRSLEMNMKSFKCTVCRISELYHVSFVCCLSHSSVLAKLDL